MLIHPLWNQKGFVAQKMLQYCLKVQYMSRTVPFTRPIQSGKLETFLLVTVYSAYRSAVDTPEMWAHSMEMPHSSVPVETFEGHADVVKNLCGGEVLVVSTSYIGLKSPSTGRRLE
jgi:hypothetical protein